jgi:hypothetical protein
LYNREVAGLSQSTREFIEENIIPEQQKTHDALSALQRRF